MARSLPSAEELRADVQRMVDFGPRLPGYQGHDDFCAWMRTELVAAGLDLIDCDEYTYDRWQPEHVALELLGAGEPEPITVATTYVRSATTSRLGIAGSLVDLGTMPTGSLLDALGGGPGDAPAPAGLAEWRAGLPEDLGGAIALVHLDLPGDLTAEIFVALQSYLHWPGHDVDDWAAIDYRRLWLGPWPALTVFEELGAGGVVFSVDASIDHLRGNYSPHTGRPQPVPAVIVDRDTGAELRARATDRPVVRLTLDAPTTEVKLRSTTAVLPGTSDEVIVVNSHSDGQNAFEENGSVALVSLARHFASLPPEQRLQRTLVFASWPGHMAGEEGLEDVTGWIVAHPDLIERAAAGVTIEHLGATEWADTERGYQPTGHNEIYGIWTTQGLAADLAKGALIDADLHRHALLKPPIQVTPGKQLHDAGVPHVSGIAGPNYLLVVSDDGEMAKFDAELAARQVGFYADVIRRLDAAPFDQLREGDETLGAIALTYRDQSTRVPAPETTSS